MPPLVSPGILSVVVRPVTTAEDAGSIPIVVPALVPILVSSVHGRLSVPGTVFIYPVSIVLESNACIVSSATSSGAVRVVALCSPRHISYPTEYIALKSSLNLRAWAPVGGASATGPLHSPGAGWHNGVGTGATAVVAE